MLSCGLHMDLLSVTFSFDHCNTDVECKFDIKAVKDHTSTDNIAVTLLGPCDTL
jgi:hypothetical protein